MDAFDSKQTLPFTLLEENDSYEGIENIRKHMSIIETSGLSKKYVTFRKEEGLRGSIKSLFRREKIEKSAVKDLSLEIAEGEFVALIGPNGAGKTTLIKMLTGIIAPSSGDVSVLGYYPNDLENDFKRRFAIVMGQKSQLFTELTASDTFLLLKEIYDIPDAEYRKNLNYFIELFSVQEQISVLVRTLSLGERMKMELIAALLHNPEVLFLDEPTIGLDAIAQKQIRRFLIEVNKERKTTIVLTSHYMEDIRSLCKRCIVINGGTKIYDGDLETLFEKYQTHKVLTASFGQETAYKAPVEVQIQEESPYKYSVMVSKDQAHQLLVDMMDKCNITDIAIEEEDIGNVVERIYNSATQAGDH